MRKLFAPRSYEGRKLYKKEIYELPSTQNTIRVIGRGRHAARIEDRCYIGVCCGDRRGKGPLGRPYVKGWVI
jgi:hypothetical protein